MKPCFKFCYFLVVAMCGVPVAWAQPAADSQPPSKAAAPSSEGSPRIQFAETEADFGRIKSGDVMKHTFVFTNTGTALLEIKDVRPSCGCTTAGSWDKRVEPGMTGLIPLQFNSAGFGGAFGKVATVICNDPERTNVLLQLKGVVWKPIDVTPTIVSFNANSEYQTNETKVVRIVNNEPEPLALSDLQCTNAAFQTSLKTIQPGKELELHITALSPFPVGTIASDISMKTSSTNVPVLHVGTYLFVQEPLTISPRQIVVPPGPLKSAMNLSVAVRNNGTAPVTLSDAAVNYTGAEVQIKESQPGSLYGLVVTLPAGFEVAKGTPVELTVKSSHPRTPLIKIPILQTPDSAILPPSAPGNQGLTRPVMAQPTRPPGAK